ncbi:MAG: Kynurenine formamidase [Chlamydiae bacterium]|nr:Kynurenine formamidase [Chlamydiota bacterium]
MTALRDFKLVDLTHTLDKEIPTWTRECGFQSEILVDYENGVRVFEYKCFASAGTHIDAPSHFIPNGRDVDQLTLEELCSPICVIDMSEELHPNAQVRLGDFEQYEKTHGKIPKDSVVIAHTGWSRYWKTPEKYWGTEKHPVFPTLSEEVGDLLIDRDVAGIGIDTFSPDPFGSDFPLHMCLLGADKFIVENLTNLEKLPKKGAFLMALPLKIAGGSESPLRAIALVPTGNI